MYEQFYASKLMQYLISSFADSLVLYMHILIMLRRKSSQNSNVLSLPVNGKCVTTKETHLLVMNTDYAWGSVKWNKQL